MGVCLGSPDEPALGSLHPTPVHVVAEALARSLLVVALQTRHHRLDVRLVDGILRLLVELQGRGQGETAQDVLHALHLQVVAAHRHGGLHEQLTGGLGELLPGERIRTHQVDSGKKGTDAHVRAS